MEITIILVLIAYIMGILTGALLVRPTNTRR